MKLAERETNEHCFIRHFEEFSSFCSFSSTQQHKLIWQGKCGWRKIHNLPYFFCRFIFPFFLFLLFILYFPILQCVPFPTQNKMENNKKSFFFYRMEILMSIWNDENDIINLFILIDWVSQFVYFCPFPFRFFSSSWFKWHGTFISHQQQQNHLLSPSLITLDWY